MRLTTRNAVALGATSLLLTGLLAACAPETDEPTASGSVSCTPEGMSTLTAGKFTVGTDSPAYSPWFVDDDPANGEGYESAVAYAVADKLGYEPDDVVWVVSSFTQAIAPGAKSFDVDLNQISYSEERARSVDFSTGYYDVTQAVITVEGSAIASASSVADLKDAKLGAMVGSTSLDAITDIIAPSSDPLVYNDNDQAKQALQAGLVDGIVLDLPTAFYITSAELDNGVLLGQLPNTGSSTEQFGFVLDKGSPLTQCVSDAVDALRADGVLDELRTQWLDGAGAPTLTE